MAQCRHAGEILLEKRHWPEVTRTDEDYDPFTAGDFTLTPEDKRNYDTEFDELRPQAGREPWAKMRNFLLNKYKLPDYTAYKIWELSDQDRDGFLDRYEFTVARCLVWRACRYGDEIPDQVVISPLSPHSIIILYIAASPSAVQRQRSTPGETGLHPHT